LALLAKDESELMSRGYHPDDIRDDCEFITDVLAEFQAECVMENVFEFDRKDGQTDECVISKILELRPAWVVDTSIGKSFRG